MQIKAGCAGPVLKQTLPPAPKENLDAGAAVPAGVIGFEDRNLIAGFGTN